MWLREWKLVQLWELLLRSMLSVRALIPETSLCFLAEEQEETAAAEQQVHPRLMIQNLLQAAEQKFRRVMHLQRESFRDSLDVLKSVNL